MHYHIPLMQILTDDLYLNYTSFPEGQEVVPPPSLAQILYLYVSLSSQGYEWVSLYHTAGNSASVLIQRFGKIFMKSPNLKSTNNS